MSRTRYGHTAELGQQSSVLHQLYLARIACLTRQLCLPALRSSDRASVVSVQGVSCPLACPLSSAVWCAMCAMVRPGSSLLPPAPSHLHRDGQLAAGGWPSVYSGLGHDLQAQRLYALLYMVQLGIIVHLLVGHVRPHLHLLLMVGLQLLLEPAAPRQSAAPSQSRGKKQVSATIARSRGVAAADA